MTGKGFLIVCDATPLIFYDTQKMVKFALRDGEGCRKRIISDKIRKKIDDLFDLLNIFKYSQDKPSRCAGTLFYNQNRFDEHVKLVKSLELP